MNKFDVEHFYSKRGIEYITHGVNVKRGEINIACPFCASEGNPDPSYHLGVQLETGYWSCWRNRRHRGRSLHRLLMKLLRVSYSEVCSILGEQESWIAEGSFDKLAENPSAIFDSSAGPLKKELLELPKEFIKFKGYVSSKRFISYLISRGYYKDDIDELIDRYDLYYCISDRWANRIILPIKLDYRLVSWTSRSIQKDTNLRYLSLSEKDGALTSIKDTIFNFDELADSGGDVLFVTEGPFDAIKMDFYGADTNVRATCLFSKNLRQSQAILINELVQSGFNKVVVLLDKEEVDTALIVQSSLSFLPVSVEIGHLPEGFKDPGELSYKEVYALADKYR